MIRYIDTDSIIIDEFGYSTDPEIAQEQLEEDYKRDLERLGDQIEAFFQS